VFVLGTTIFSIGVVLACINIALQKRKKRAERRPIVASRSRSRTGFCSSAP